MGLRELFGFGKEETAPEPAVEEKEEEEKVSEEFECKECGGTFETKREADRCCIAKCSVRIGTKVEGGDIIGYEYLTEEEAIALIGEIKQQYLSGSGLIEIKIERGSGKVEVLELLDRQTISKVYLQREE